MQSCGVWAEAGGCCFLGRGVGGYGGEGGEGFDAAGCVCRISEMG